MDPDQGYHSEAESEPDADAEPEARAGPARVLTPWPVPIRELPEPEPGPLEPIARERHDELVAALKEARRTAIADQQAAFKSYLFRSSPALSCGTTKC